MLFQANSNSSPGAILNEQQSGVFGLLLPSNPNSFTFSTTSATQAQIDQQYVRWKKKIINTFKNCHE